jgi:hypothetical protein
MRPHLRIYFTGNSLKRDRKIIYFQSHSMFSESLICIVVSDCRFVWGQNELLDLQTLFEITSHVVLIFTILPERKHICRIVGCHILYSWRIADIFDGFIQVIGVIFTLFASQRFAIKWWK